MKKIGAANGRKVRMVKGFTWLLKFFGLFKKTINKAFGNLSYDQTISEYKVSYTKYSLDESISETERQ